VASEGNTLPYRAWDAFGPWTSASAPSIPSADMTMDFKILNPIASLLDAVTSGAGLLSIAAAAIALPLMLNVLTGNGMVKTIPVIGMRRHAFTQVPAKIKYLTGGRALLFGTMKKLKSISWIRG
jgi:hypothetical protein